MLSNVGSGGGAAAAPGAGGAAAGGAAAPAEGEAKAEGKEEGECHSTRLPGRKTTLGLTADLRLQRRRSRTRIWASVSSTRLYFRFPRRLPYFLPLHFNGCMARTEMGFLR